MSDEEKTAKSEASPSWIGFLLPPLVVIAAGFLWVAVARQDSPGGTSLGTRGLRNDGVYYVHISQIELYPTSQDDEAWDSGGAAPDIRYKIVWQGNTIHESSTDDDALIADWSGVRDGALDKLLGEDIVKAAQVRALKDDRLSIYVEDVDITVVVDVSESGATADSRIPQADFSRHLLKGCISRILPQQIHASIAGVDLR